MEETVNRGRHEAQCSICSHPRRVEIELAFINWHNLYKICVQFEVSRYAVYRHAHALGLFSQRERNVRTALHHIIENAETAHASASAVVSAIKLLLALSRPEEQVEAGQRPNLKELLDRMSQEDREAFARDGSLPQWVLTAIGATPADRQAGEKASQATDTTRVQ